MMFIFFLSDKGKEYKDDSSIFWFTRPDPNPNRVGMGYC